MNTDSLHRCLEHLTAADDCLDPATSGMASVRLMHAIDTVREMLSVDAVERSWTVFASPEQKRYDEGQCEKP